MNTEDSNPTSKSNKPLLIIISLLTVLVLASVGARIYLAKKEGHQMANKEALAALDFFLFESPRKLSPVTLENMKGEEKIFSEHLSGWRVVNFGYMFCPDICPINLSFLSDVKNTWDKQFDDTPLSVLHITFDPDRDKPELLNKYLTYMHADFYGLTGNIDNIKAITQQLNVVFIFEAPDENGNYFVTHSDSMALINPQGEYVGLFKGPYDKENMLKALKRVIYSG